MLTSVERGFAPPRRRGTARGVRYRREVESVVTPLIRDIAGTRTGAMFGHPAFFSGRKVFACVYGGGIALRLPAETVTRVGRRKDVFEFRPHGRRMRSWVEIRRARAEDYRRDAALFREAATFARMLDGSARA